MTASFSERIAIMRTRLIVVLLAAATVAAAAPGAAEQFNHVRGVAGGVINLGLISGVFSVSEPSHAPGNQNNNGDNTKTLANSAQNDFRWNGRIEAGRAIEIRGINGSVHAEPSAGNEVEVTATKRARRSNPDEVRIQVVEHDGGVTICAVYPGRDGKVNDCRVGEESRGNVRDSDVVVDFEVRVPAGIRFVARTVNGEIETGLIGSDVQVSSVNGSIRASATGFVEAQTVNGSIHASMGTANWSDPLEFKTINGEITLDLPANTNTDVTAETINGDITTDFPVTVQGRITRRRLNATIGNGGRELRLKTINGSINVRRAT